MTKAKELKMYELISNDPCINSETNFFIKENEKIEKNNNMFKKKESARISNVSLEFNKSEMNTDRIRSI